MIAAYLVLLARWVWGLAVTDWLDIDVVILIATALAGVWVAVSEARAHRRDADERIALHARLASLEVAVASQSPSTIAERVASLEGAERVSPEDLAALRERIATIEARIDHRNITPTIRKTRPTTKKGK